MAYGDWGAFIWKNGANITEICGDTGLYKKDGKISTKVNEEEKERLEQIDGGHAAIGFGDFGLVFYKTYDPKIWKLGAGEKSATSIGKFPYENKKLKLRINRRELSENIYMYEIEHKGDIYCVIIGNAVGNGWEKQEVSKYILKNIYFDIERKWYIIKSKRTVYIGDVIDKLQREDNIKFKKYELWTFGIKPFIKDLIRLRVGRARYHLDDILDYIEEIKWKK